MQETTEADFQKDVLDHKGVVVVDFYTTWCNPCKQLAPILEELDKEMEGVKFVKVNAEEHASLAAQYEVRSVPLLTLIKDGQVQDTLMGLQPKEALQEKLQELIQ
jgi:thioredoxin 1